MNNATEYDEFKDIAIIGMAGRFPGAKNLEEFWQNLQDGVESVTTFTDAELRAAGVDKSLINDPNYVKSGAILEDIDLFDAAFFEFNPKEAENTDPQHRLFLECVWEALENAGYDSTRCEGRIGVYAGSALGTYTYLTLDNDCDYIGSAVNIQKLIGNDKDFLSTRVSYKLNLCGPSINVQTACSTSLVAVSLAYQSLLNYQCDMALAGGVSIVVPQKTGYSYQEGGILSKDGHCRAFDAKAGGTVVGNGVGVVLLKRLVDAIADGDYIHAIIKGTALNNDGANKVGYTAPSVKGQVEAVSEALTLAGVEPETIGYIETHGTGTSLGDPIEIAALTHVFRASTEKKGFCAIGSVKTNVGHLNTAAGVTGLIKTVLALKHKLIPPSLNFEQPNPQIDFANSPFYVATQLQAWPSGETPRRAGVSSFGIGGTNVHLILEEAPLLLKSQKLKANRKYSLLCLSAKTATAIKQVTANLIAHLEQNPDLDLADIAYTLQVGRRSFNYRQMVVCNDIKDAITVLESQSVFAHCQENIKRSTVFMFPGQGAQYVNMARELYDSEPGFREQIDDCAVFLQPLLGLDLRDILYPDGEDTEEFTAKLQQTAIAQPALFAIEYALAQLWMKWGVHPTAMIGHSIGEYVAACLSGVFSLEDALSLVAARGQLMQQLPSGTMLVVHLTQAECQPLLNSELSLAAVNGPFLCVISGSTTAIDGLENELASAGVEYHRLQTSHAFHSSMMNPILDSFTEKVKQIRLNPPKIPYLSNVTGTWITAAQATDPSYWSNHLRSTVRFADGLFELLKEPTNILLEVGPGRTLSTLAKRHPDHPSEQVILSSVRHPQHNASDVAFLLNTLGQLWLAGVQIDWLEFYSQQKRDRLPLPTYPFERQRYWPQSSLPSLSSKHSVKGTSETEWQYKALPGRLVNYLLSPLTISQRLVAQLPELMAQIDSKILTLLSAQMEANSVAYILQAFQKMGWRFQKGDCFSVAELAKKLGVISQYQQLLGRLLEILAQEGMLLPIDDRWKVIQDQQILDPQEMINHLLAQYPENVAEISLLQRCGVNLADVLQGNCDPLELLHPKVYDQAANQRLQESPSAKLMQTLVQRAVLLALEQCQGEKQPTLRVLEIGAGIGLTTAYILPILNPANTEYVYTDISPFFTAQAQDKFRDYPFVRYQLLDIEQNPSNQGFGLHQFDLAIAANVLHATQNLRHTLQHVQQLLAPGGMLVLLELTDRLRFIDLTFGLTEGWWRFADRDLRPDYPLLSSAKWLDLLQESGFSEAATIPPQTEKGISAHQAVIVAQSRVATVEPSNWLILCDAKGTGQTLASLLTSQGDVCIQVFPGKKYEQLAALEFSVDSSNPTDFQRLFESLPTPLSGIIHLWSLNAVETEISTIRDLETTVETACRSASNIVQQLNSTSSQSPSLWLVTRGTQPIETEPNIFGLAQSRLWKMGKAILLDHPELNCIQVDLDPDCIRDDAEFLFQEINSPTQADQLAFRGKMRYVACLIAPSKQEKDATRLDVNSSDHILPTLSDVVRYDGSNQSISSLIVGQISQLLGIAPEQVDIEEPLVYLGLDSLVIIELRKRLSDALEVNIPLATFLDGSSIAKLENQIKEAIASQRQGQSQVQTGKASPSLVALQPSGSGLPLFCIHPVAGVAFPYYELACQLGDKQPVYGLQSVGFGDDEEPLTSIEEMAEHYIQDLRTVQPTGPYHLIAWSFGALVAFEMAVQLEQAGEKVDLLAVIDTPPPSLNKIGSAFLALKFVFISLLPYIWPYVYDYLELSLTAHHPSQSSNLVQRAGKKLLELTQTQSKSRQAHRSELLMKSRQPNINRLLRLILKNFIASGNYEPSTHVDKIHLFRTNGNPWGVERDNTLGWSNFAKGGVEIYQIPGHHLNVLRTPNVQVLAQKLKTCLNHVHSQEKELVITNDTK